jgi:ribosomal protein S21
MLYATKKANESNERLISRFKKVVQRSRILFDVKKHRYFEREKRKLYIRQAAVRRDSYRKQNAKEQYYSS